MNERMIAKLEAMGFKRWTKAGKDRLYISVRDCDYVEYEWYKTSNVKSCCVCGEIVSNSAGAAARRARAYIDVITGEIYDDGSSVMQTVITKMVEDAEAEINAEDAEIENKEEIEVNASERIAEVNAMIERVNAEIDENASNWLHLNGLAGIPEEVKKGEHDRIYAENAMLNRVISAARETINEIESPAYSIYNACDIGDIIDASKIKISAEQSKILNDFERWYEERYLVNI